MLTRRDALLGIAGATMTAAGPAFAQEKKLTVVAHAVHRAAATTGKGGDITAAWREKNGASIEWLTFGVDATNERALREASLAQGSIDIAFVARDGRIIKVYSAVRPWRMAASLRAFAVVELREGGLVAASTEVGDTLALVASGGR